MSRKAVVPRALARRDVEAAVDYHSSEAGIDAALGFIEDLQQAYHRIVDHPASGSPRYGRELALPGLRSLQLKRYPYLVFYVEGTDRIDVWRVLNARRDVPTGMQEPAAEGGQQ